MSTQTQAERPAQPTLYTFDAQTGEYKPDITSTSQWSPRENKWLIPRGATKVAPPAEADKKARCWNPTTQTWEQKPDHRGEKWYDKATRELHEIKDIGVEPDTANWTQTEPKDLESIWDEETSAWVIPPEVQEQRDVAAAKSQANSIIAAAMQRSAVQTMSFAPAEFKVMAKAKLFDEWEAGASYTAGQRIAYNGVVYEVVQDVTAQSHQTPASAGMLAIYRPLSLDESGAEHAGTLEDPIPWAYGIKIEQGKYYSHNGKTWYAIQPQNEALWEPGAQGTEALWKEVNTEA